MANWQSLSICISSSLPVSLYLLPSSSISICNSISIWSVCPSVRLSARPSHLSGGSCLSVSALLCLPAFLSMDPSSYSILSCLPVLPILHFPNYPGFLPTYLLTYPSIQFSNSITSIPHLHCPIYLPSYLCNPSYLSIQTYPSCIYLSRSLCMFSVSHAAPIPAYLSPLASWLSGCLSALHCDNLVGWSFCIFVHSSITLYLSAVVCQSTSSRSPSPFHSRLKDCMDRGRNLWNIGSAFS